MSDKWRVTSDEQEGVTANLQDEEQTEGFRDSLALGYDGCSLSGWCYFHDTPAQMRRCAPFELIEELRKTLKGLRRKLVTRH